MKRNLRYLLLIFGIGVLVLSIVYSSLAAEFPTKTITIINPYAPGGSMDLICRIIAQHLGPILKQAVIVENRTGGGGVVGYTAAAKAPADGYTLTLIATPMIFNYLATPGVPFTHESFAPIAHLQYEENLLLIKTGSKLDMPADKLFTYVKQHPKEIAIGTGGRWAVLHIAAELLELTAEMQFRKVHFTGTAPALTNLLGGHVDMLFNFYSDSFMHITSGGLKPVAVASEKRFSSLPNTPTFRELGINLIIGAWRGLGAPAGTPEPILDVLENACRDVLKNPEVIKEFHNIKMEPSFKDRKTFCQLIAVFDKDMKLVISRIKESKE
jgi:tripartite-type tricarboxylate transporter receptor subunit TctC